ncbi:MAG: hypothetical protein NVSMB13_20820 [Mycobacteriales bacterium]
MSDDAKGGTGADRPPDLLGPLREVTDRMRRLSEAGLGALGHALPAPATELLGSMQTLIAQVPTPIAQLEMVVAEIRTRREQVKALRIGLAAFEEQLDLLERSLVPVLEWNKQWLGVQEVMLDSFRKFGLPDLRGSKRKR